MRDSSGQETYYHGSLKELAAAHLALVKASMLFLVLEPTGFLIAWIFHEGLGNFVVGCLLFGPPAVCIIWWAVAVNRLSSLLYPQVSRHLTAVSLVPGLNFVVYFILWRASLGQMRARGLRVGVFGVAPAWVD